MKLCTVFMVLVVIFGTAFSRHSRIGNRINFKDAPTALEHKENRNITLINLKIHIDNVLVDNLTKEHGRLTRNKMKLLAKNLIDDVEKIFRNLHRNIKFNLLDTKFLRNNSNLVKIDENGSKYLKSYCNRQAEKKKIRWYYSVLLTGLDLYYIDNNGNRKQKSTGRGYMNGMCSTSNSCALLEWHPKIISFLLAHEIAHSLGISHDGPPHNRCKARGDMMGAKYNAENHPKSWSNCSKRDLKKYLASEKSWCIRPDNVSHRITGHL